MGSQSSRTSLSSSSTTTPKDPSRRSLPSSREPSPNRKTTPNSSFYSFLSRSNMEKSVSSSSHLDLKGLGVAEVDYEHDEEGEEESTQEKDKPLSLTPVTPHAAETTPNGGTYGFFSEATTPVEVALAARKDPRFKTVTSKQEAQSHEDLARQ
eukprot:gene24940-31340_t